MARLWHRWMGASGQRVLIVVGGGWCQAQPRGNIDVPHGTPPRAQDVKSRTKDSSSVVHKSCTLTTLQLGFLGSRNDWPVAHPRLPLD